MSTKTQYNYSTCDMEYQNNLITKGRLQSEDVI